jgi:hypothetical protein
LFPQVARAATARVRWLPSNDPGVTRYDVYVRNGGDRYTTQPSWSGKPTPDAGGALSAVVTFTPARSGANWFAVVAVTAAEESPLSRELATGTPNPCRADSCSTKTSCNFSVVPDGTACDDDSFCNGAEMCRNGFCDGSAPRNCADSSACTVDACDEAKDTCTHVASPGCCAACDGSDPCLADACAAGDCSAPPGGEVTIGRMRFVVRDATTKLSLRGTFPADRDIDPSVDGMILELRTTDGALLHASAVAPEAFTAAPSGRRFTFGAARDDDDAADDENGLDKLTLRRSGARWLVTAQLEAPALRDAADASAITVVLRTGGTCVRRLDASCEQSGARAAVCR